MTDKIRQLDQAIWSMIHAVETGEVRPDRSWSESFNALWKKRNQLKPAYSKAHPNQIPNINERGRE